MKGAEEVEKEWRRVVPPLARDLRGPPLLEERTSATGPVAENPDGPSRAKWKMLAQKRKKVYEILMRMKMRRKRKRTRK